jgi:hypothetical protein
MQKILAYTFIYAIIKIGKEVNKMTTLKEIEKMEKMKEEISKMWDWLLDMGIATEEELQLVTDINGYSLETLNDILFARTGYRDQE